MNGLRVLVVERNPSKAEEKAEALSALSHSAYAVTCLEEVAEALSIERFDAVLVDCEVANSDTLRSELARVGAKIDDSMGLISFTSATSTEELRANLGRLEQKNAARPEAGRAIFLAADFNEQCAGEVQLMVEIIDLFLHERDRQFPDMRAALEDGDLKHLSHVAHTIKGSLASLHAPVAWERAQRLELAAKSRDVGECEHTLNALKGDIALLEPQLLAFREACLVR